MNALQVGVGAAPVLDHPVEPAQQFGNPAGAQLHAAPAQAGMALEHAVQHHHGQEGLRPLVQQGDVLGAQVLAAAQPVLGRRAAVVHPRPWPAAAARRRRAARTACRSRPAAPRTDRGRRGRASARRRAGAGPRPPSARLEREVELGHGQRRDRRAARRPRPSAACRRRRSRPCAGCGPARRRSAASASSLELAENGMATLWVANTSCLLKPEQVERLGAVGARRTRPAPGSPSRTRSACRRGAICAATCSALCRPPWPTITATSSSVTIEAE